jgi:prepilin-type N-terminal cleavage/methylation domain-containing protein
MQKVSKNFKKGFSLIEISIVLLIIGILISGILVGQDLILDAKIKSAQNLTRTSPVNKITDLTLWLDVNAEKSLISTTAADRCLSKYMSYQDLLGNETICAWRDINSQKSLGTNMSDKIALSINTAHAINAMPTYVVNGIGGLPSLYFDGSDYLISSIPPSTDVANTIFDVDLYSLLSSSEVSFFIVQQFEGAPTLTSNPSTLFYNTENFLVRSNDRVNLGDYTPTLKFGNDNHRLSSKLLSTVTAPQVLAFTRDATSVKLTINSFFNLPVSPSPTSTTISNSSAPIYLGTEGLSTGNLVNAFKGKISEIIVFNRRISERERIQVENYLLQKYKIKKA